MAKRIIAIGGEPAAGKTTLMRKILKQYPTLKPFKFGLVRGQYCEERNLYFIGVYDDSTFSGTDKLSMAVQPVFLKFIDYIKEGTIVFEGDRLFNSSLFEKVKCQLYVLQADPETLKARHIERKDDQPEKFLRARKTKTENIIANHNVIILKNNTQDESEKAFQTILTAIENGQN